MKLCFGDIVVVEDNLIGVVVKSWYGAERGGIKVGEPNYDIYVRYYNSIENYPESKVERYMVRHKELDEQEMEWQYNATHKS